MPESEKPNPAIGLRIATPPVAAHVPHDIGQTDPDLAFLVEAWPDLPEALRVGIVAMAESARAAEPDRRPVSRSLGGAGPVGDRKG